MKANNFMSPKSTQQLPTLSIDGGGIRGIVPAIILAHLEKLMQEKNNDPNLRIANLFDFFVGTSAGGILAALYLTPDPIYPTIPKFSAAEILEIYTSGALGVFNNKKEKSNSKYSSEHLEHALQGLLGKETTLGQLLKPIVITAYQLDQKKAIFFQSWVQQDCLAWQVCRATSAAPGMFEAAIVDQYDANLPMIDGSIFASNPSLCAYTLARSLDFSIIPNAEKNIKKPTIEHLVLVSLGTGKVTQAKSEKRQSYIRMMMEQLMEVGTNLVDTQLKQLFNGKHQKQYFRINPTLFSNKKAIDETGSEHIQQLVSSVEQYLHEQKWLMEQVTAQLSIETFTNLKVS